MFVGKSVLKNLVSFSYSLLTLTFAKSLEIYTIVLKILNIWVVLPGKKSIERRKERKEKYAKKVFVEEGTAHLLGNFMASFVVCATKQAVAMHSFNFWDI